jgi:hypothetical protein
MKQQDKALAVIAMAAAFAANPTDLSIEDEYAISMAPTFDYNIPAVETKQQRPGTKYSKAQRKTAKLVWPASNGTYRKEKP